jgi:elongation factor P
VSSIFFGRTQLHITGDFCMNANEIRKGMVLLYNNDPHSVMESHHRTPGNLRAFVQVRLRNLRSGNSFETRFSSTESVERATLERHDMEFLYKDEDLYHFMNTEDYEQVAINGDSLGDAAKYMAEGIKVQIEFYGTEPISVDLPGSIELEVVETEPEVKGGTASNSPKPAKLSNGVMVMVPPFIKQGEKVRINPNEDKYLERVK